MFKFKTGLMLGLFTAVLSASAQAAPIQIGSFTSDSGDYTYDSGALTGTTFGTFVFTPEAVAQLGATAGDFDGASLTVDATATGAITNTGGFLSQEMEGTITILDSGGNLLLKTTFSGAFLRGDAGVDTATLGGSTLAGASVVYDSDDFDATQTTDPRSFQFILTPTDPVLSVDGDNFADFTAPDSANFSAAVAAPEPGLLVLFGLGLTAVGRMARRRRI